MGSCLEGQKNLIPFWHIQLCPAKKVFDISMKLKTFVKKVFCKVTFIQSATLLWFNNLIYDSRKNLSRNTTTILCCITALKYRLRFLKRCDIAPILTISLNRRAITVKEEEGNFSTLRIYSFYRILNFSLLFH